ncbi:hypothetical protein MPSEU_000645000 [Mayamaea pseudoterrestris]|nr:hypothetical protein MPSEU_000645000 [Mayamaea pseudoterrestris]
MSRSIRSLESEASNAFKSPTQLTAKRMGHRPLSPRSANPSSGASVGTQSRRSVSMIQTAEDEEVFTQIGGATAVTMPSKQGKKQERVRSPLSFMDGKFSMDDVVQGSSMDEFMKGANAAAEMLMQSISPKSCTPGGEQIDQAHSQEGGLWSFMSSKPSMTSYGNQTASSAQRTPLDLHHNDNSFHVLANLLIDFLQTKLTPDGCYIVLQPEDRIRMERVLPEMLRLDFIDAVIYRLANTSPKAKSPIDILTLQCHELGVNRDGRMNPILAAANIGDEPIYIPVQSLLDEQAEEAQVASKHSDREANIPSDESSAGTLNKNPTATSLNSLHKNLTARSTESKIGLAGLRHNLTARSAESKISLVAASYSNEASYVPVDAEACAQPEKVDEIEDVRLLASEEVSLATTIPENSTIPALASKVSSNSQRSNRSAGPARISPVPSHSEPSSLITSKPPKSLEQIAAYVIEEEDLVSQSATKATSMFGFKIPSLSNDLTTNDVARPDENLSPVSNAGGFFSSMNPFVGFGFGGKCDPEQSATKAALERQKQHLSMSVQHTFSESVATSPINAFRHDREMTLEETKTLAKEQLYAEIREAQVLISQSKSPETVAFWEEHVTELHDRIRAIDDDYLDNESMTTMEQTVLVSEEPLPPAAHLQPMSTAHDNQQLVIANPSLVKAVTAPGRLHESQKDYDPSASALSIKTVTTPISPKVATTPASPSNDHMQWKQELSYDVPMVDVVAPADLPGGYHFEAELEGKRFLATVPAGGVKQGETFTCYMRELDSVAIDIPVGYWKDSMGNVCAYGCCHPVFWNPIICPLTSLWQIQTRVGLDFLGRPLEEGAPPPVPNRTTLLTVLVSWFLMNIGLMAGCNYKWSRGLNLTFADISAIALVNFSMIAFLVFITQSTRSSIREKFMIREHRCSDLEDIYVSTIALPCTIAQMSRHTANYDDYEAVCCSKTGLPAGVRVNQCHEVETGDGTDTNKSPSGYTAPKYDAPAALV